MGSERDEPCKRCFGDGYNTCMCIEPDEQRAGGVTKADLADAECYCDVCGSDDALGVRPICMVCYTSPTNVAEQLAAAERERDSLARSFDAAATARGEMEALRDAATARATLLQSELDHARGKIEGMRAAAARAETAEGLLRDLCEAVDRDALITADDVWAAQRAARSHLQTAANIFADEEREARERTQKRRGRA